MYKVITSTDKVGINNIIEISLEKYNKTSKRHEQNREN